MRLLNIKINKMHLLWDCSGDPCGAVLLITSAAKRPTGHFSGCQDPLYIPLSCLIAHPESRAHVIMYRLYIPLDILKVYNHYSCIHPFQVTKNRTCAG